MTATVRLNRGATLAAVLAGVAFCLYATVGFAQSGCVVIDGVRACPMGPDPVEPGGSDFGNYQQDYRDDSERIERNARYDRFQADAVAAWERGDYVAALQAYRQAQALRDGPNVREAIAQAEAAIAQRAAQAIVADANAASERGDLNAALALYRQAQSIYPDVYTEEGKQFVRAFEARVGATNTLQQSLETFTQTMNPAPVAPGLDFGAVPARSCGPSTNSSVVDACNVPSGLPAATDNAIAAAWGDASPGVRDRVRKAFEAVTVRDWQVAKAWFEDALDQNPGDANIRRYLAILDAPPEPRRAAAIQNPAIHDLQTLDANAAQMSTDEVMRSLGDILEAQYTEALLLNYPTR